MFETLLVPLDGSRLAEHAVPYAIRLAQAWHARLVLMQATDIDLDKARGYLAQIAATIAGQVPALEVTAQSGPTADRILDAVAAFRVDAVVMTTHGRTGFDHLRHGSVTEAILARSSVPVFVVYSRPGEAPPPPFSPASARLLVPQDGTDYDSAALSVAVDMLGPRGEIVLVTVVPPPEHVLRDTSGRRVLAYLDQQEEALTREAREYLTGVATPLRTHEVPVNVKIDVRLGDPASGIGMAAMDNAADLIVMATHGRTGINRAVLGSVAGCVLRTACAPVVLVHPTASPPTDPKVIDYAFDDGFRSPVGAVPTF
jgi:nucleotide-binding universal stress UspA family protein